MGILDLNNPITHEYLVKKGFNLCTQLQEFDGDIICDNYYKLMLKDIFHSFPFEYMVYYFPKTYSGNIKPFEEQGTTPQGKLLYRVRIDMSGWKNDVYNQCGGLGYNNIGLQLVEAV